MTIEPYMLWCVSLVVLLFVAFTKNLWCFSALMVSDLWITAHISNPFWIKGEGFFLSMHRLTLSIYNGVIQGHVNRLNHVQSVFARPPAPLSLSHTPSLSCSACSYHSLTPSLLCTLTCFALLSFPSLCLSLSISFAHWGWRRSEDVVLSHRFIPSPSVSLSFYPSCSTDFLSLLFSINPHTFPCLRFPLCQSSFNITSVHSVLWYFRW